MGTNIISSFYGTNGVHTARIRVPISNRGRNAINVVEYFKVF